MQKIEILGVKVNNVDYQKAIEKIEKFINSGKPHQICTVNPEYIMAAQKDEEFRRILNQADLCLPDGVGLIWASRFLSKKLSLSSSRPITPLSVRVTGVDLIWQIARLAADRGYSLYLLGAGPGVAEQTALVLRRRYPNLKIVGAEIGLPVTPFHTLEYRSVQLILRRVQKAKPDILLVAFGHPKQDKFIAKYKKELAVPVMMGVGGAFDFISGRIKRAPKWMQKIGLEWLFRLLLEPRRLNRILTAAIRFPWAIMTGKSK